MIILVQKISSRFSLALILLMLSGHSQGQANLRDQHGINYPIAICGDGDPASGNQAAEHPGLRALKKEISLDPAFPAWARDSLYWHCDSNNIVWVRNEWLITDHWTNDLTHDGASLPTEYLSVIYSPDFKSWAGMLEILENIPGKTEPNIRRIWLNEPPPGYKQILFMHAVDPSDM